MGVEACTQFQLPFVLPMFLGSCDPYGDQSMHVLYVHMVLRKIFLGNLVVVLREAHRKLVAGEIEPKTKLAHFLQRCDQSLIAMNAHLIYHHDL